MTSSRHARTPLYLLAAVVGSLLWTASRAPGLTLVADGAPQAVLIVEAESPKALRAAEAIRTYVKQMSGAELPLVIEGEALPADAPPARMHVGHTAVAKGQNVPSGFDPTIRPDAFEEEGYVQERMMSEEYCGFAVKLARAFPDKWISLSAYSLREVPPQGIALPSNVAVANLFPISTCALHAGNDPACWRRQETMQIAATWRKLTPHVVMAHYVPGQLSHYGAGQQAQVPERDTALMAVEAPILKQMGLKGIRGASWVRGQAHFMSTWLAFYVRAKFTWDVDADIAAIKQEFYSTFFGPGAGPHIQAWWDACEDELVKS